MTSCPRDAGRSAVDWVTIPNALSLLRLASVPFFVGLFVAGAESAAVVLYGVGAITDFFDGYLARRWGQISEFGRLLDPLADRVFIVALAAALIARGALPWWLAAAIVLRDIILLSLWPLFERRRAGRIAVNFTGKTATALLLFGLLWLAVGETGWVASRDLRPLGLGSTIAGAALYWVAAVMYAREAVRRLRGGQGIPP
jgi:cardiolipin synthase